jgi:hypothetical protein
MPTHIELGLYDFPRPKHLQPSKVSETSQTPNIHTKSSSDLLTTIADENGNDIEQLPPMGLSFIKESFIISTLAARGVKNISAKFMTDPVVKDEKNISANYVSKSGLITVDDKQAKKPYPTFDVNLNLEKIPGSNMKEFEFRDIGQFGEAFIKVTNTLNDIYKAGFLHNDITSKNLMISVENGVVKTAVIDFNAATPLNSDKKTIMVCCLAGSYSQLPRVDSGGHSPWPGLPEISPCQSMPCSGTQGHPHQKWL